ncbi:hypothetical protein [Nonlabens sp.]|uniref:hypothetical protein n=2 Tax=Nonlabens sp. TaxID=1888209 RepID=UPI0032644223
MTDILIPVLFFLVIFSPVIYQLVLVLKEKKNGTGINFKRLKLILKISLASIILIAIFIAILSHTNYLDYKKPMTFDQYEDITFKDFKGIELFKKSLYGNERFAYIYTTIDYDINEDHILIQSFFHPSRSFVYDQQTYSEELLRHEKYHFKITELFTRKAKQEISILSYTSSSEVLDIIENTYLEEREFQKKYDYDTFHSYVLGEQKKYERQIDSLLLDLQSFNNPKIIIDVQN